MANNKTGFDYYNVDTDRYLDMRIKRLRKEFGCNGIAVYDYILCEIYRVKGCFIVWDESTAFDVADYFGIKDTAVMEIVKYCGYVGLFDKELLSRGVVTSQSIQKRFLEMSRRSKRNFAQIPEECAIVPEECAKRVEESPQTSGSLPQSKVKESIVEESKEENIIVGGEPPTKQTKISLQENLKRREEDLYASLVPFIPKYGKQMLREFYDYWTETNKSGTKMRIDGEKSWDVSKRLDRWHNNNYSAKNRPEKAGGKSDVDEYKAKREQQLKRASEIENGNL